MDAAAAARALRFLAGVFLGSSGSAASSGRSSGSLGHFDEVCYREVDRSRSMWIEAVAVQHRSEVCYFYPLRIHPPPRAPGGGGRSGPKWAEVGRWYGILALTRLARLTTLGRRTRANYNCTTPPTAQQWYSGAARALTARGAPRAVRRASARSRRGGGVSRPTHAHAAASAARAARRTLAAIFLSFVVSFCSFHQAESRFCSV